MQQLLFAQGPLTEDSNNYLEFCNALGSERLLSPDELGQRLRRVMPSLIGRPIRTLALFSGAGGLDIGFSDAGFEIIETVEIEAKFVKTMQYNKEQGVYLRHANVLCVDVREYYPSFDHKLDFIIGGPPCQSFSAAGRRAAGVAGTKDERGGLFEEYVRLLRQFQPMGFLFENVYGLLGAEKGEAIRKISLAFRQVGYDVSYRVLDAADYGTPQHRERLIIVGVRKDLGVHYEFPRPTHGPDAGGVPHLSAAQAVAGAYDPTERLPSVKGRFGHLLQEVPPGLNYSFFTEKMGHPEPIFAWRSKFSDFLYKADPDMPIRTLKASGGQYTGPFHWDGRHFTVAELKRLQTFPDDYHITGNRAVASKQIGNSVPPQFGRILALSVLEQLFGVRLPIPLRYLPEGEQLGFRSRKREKTEAYQAKAQGAKPVGEHRHKSEVADKEYAASLMPNQRLVVHETEGDYRIYFMPSTHQWQLTLISKQLSMGGPEDEPSFVVLVRKEDGEALFAGVKSVRLVSYDPGLRAHSVLWKAFERELSIHKLKADLVQLNGYYQYPSNLTFELAPPQQPTPSEAVAWQAVENIYLDKSNNLIRPSHRITGEYDLSEVQLAQAFGQLREAGYEIRNTNTNPEIEPGHYLIPYKFPTLTHLSVQLKRSLS